MFVSNLLHTVPAQTLGLTQLKVLMFNRVFVVPYKGNTTQHCSLPKLKPCPWDLENRHSCAPQSRHGEGLYPYSLSARTAAAEQEGALTKDSFPPRDQAQHLPRQYTEILQKWKGGSRLLFPLHKYRKFWLLLRQSHGRKHRREGKKTHGD